MTKYEDHPIAAAFPLLSEKELEELSADIAAHGLRQDIILFEDKILDGRNRYRACLKAGVAPRYDEYQGDDPVAFVVSLNLRRRDLTLSQRAMVAASLATMKRGAPAGNSNATSGDAENKSLNRGNCFSQADAAEKLGVSIVAVERASTVQRQGVPELAEAVRKGEASVSAAAAVAKLEPEEQREAVKGGRKGVAKAARTTRTAQYASEPAPNYEDESQEPEPAAARVVSSEQVGATVLSAAKPEKSDVPFSGVANGRKVKIEGETVYPAVLKAKEAHEWEMLSLHAVASRLLTGDVGGAAVITKNYVVAFARA